MPRIIRRFILESVFSMLLYSFVQVLMLHILLGVGLWAFAFQKPWDGSIVWIFVLCFFLCLPFGPLRPDVHALGYEFDPLGPTNFVDHA